MRILFIGDVVDKAGVDAVIEYLPKAIAEWKVELAVVNGENSALGGFGITEATYTDLVNAGADAVTLGNHSWNRKEALIFINSTVRLIRPINYLPSAPSRGAGLIETKGGRTALVINALGRLFIDPVEDPFSSIDSEISRFPLERAIDAIVVAFYCEATSQKQAAEHFYYDGRVSLVVGTHTHTPSADHRILPLGPPTLQMRA